jgi:uncharacterized protein (TIGR00251 family)
MRINIKVIPKSKKDEVIEGDPFVVRVTDPPEKNKANRKVIKLLSKHFDAKVSIIRGLGSREKVIEVIER